MGDNAAMTRFLVFVGALLASGAALVAAAQQAAAPDAERDFLTRVRRLTVEGRRAGEGYWSPDGKRLVFQSEREPGNPFYQIYVLDLATGDTKRISPGIGKTTCAFFRPGTDEIEFASTHADPKSKQYAGRGARLPRVRQGAPLLVGLRPGDGHLRVQREDRRAEAADRRARATTPKAATRRTASGSRSRRCATPTTAR